MIRGVRGATTVTRNDADEIVQSTKQLLDEIIDKNKIKPDDVAQVLISVTEELTATFPAKALRQLQGWTFVPVMCTREIPVPGALEKCVRIMLTVNTNLGQEEIQHVYLNNAVQLRPDLSQLKSH